MSLASVSIHQVRCIDEADLSLSPGLTLISGENGSGKTSLLEGIYLLGRGRSFRTRNNSRLIQADRDRLRVTGVLERDGISRSLGIEISLDGTPEARLGGGPVESYSELAQAFPVQVIEPGVHKLVEEGSHRRRRWMDWATFHVEPRFLETWSRYARALRQRNAALKGATGDPGIWDAELAPLGESLSQARATFLQQLEPYWKDAIATLTGLTVELRYHRGWSQGETLATALGASRSRDQQSGRTHAGPHRGDVMLRLRGRPAREVLSRGQQKLVAIAMTVAQLRLLQEVSELTPTLLLDDPAAELDAERLQRFIAYVSDLNCQLIVTSLTTESRLFGAPGRTFRVVQGRVNPV